MSLSLTLLVPIMNKILCIQSSPVTILVSSLWIVGAVDFDVEELQELNGKGATIVIHLTMGRRPIIRPAVAAIESIEMIEVGFQPLGRIDGAILLQGEVCKDTEPQPIGVWHFPIVDAAEPVLDIGPFLIRQRLPELLGSHTQSEAQRTHLDHALVQVFGVTPEFRVGWICAVAQALEP